jgi:diguanylate cyclase (GGDEF)-like protein
MKPAKGTKGKAVPRETLKTGAAKRSADRVGTGGSPAADGQRGDVGWLGLMARMGELLRACQSRKDGHAVISEFGPLLIPGTAGALYAPDPELNHMEAVASWGPDLESETVFAVRDCWALRRGQVHRSGSGSDALACHHMKPDSARDCLEVPASVAGGAMYLLHLEFPGSAAGPEGQARAEVVADRMAVALSHLSMTESLKSKAIRDCLTGLFNRGYMEEALGIEIRRARREQGTVGVVMMDLDHFKRFNTAYGYEEGDAFLKEIGTLMARQVRNGDICCRQGKDEFVVILPRASLDVALQRAEKIREALQSFMIVTGTDPCPFEKITASLGVAIYPDHGEQGDELLSAADKALSRAMVEGGNRVAAAEAKPV